ncbi:uncharacterized protein PpBr36_10229 [Pyricularia pennisetigena]|uniref:uncharacterized protein n=1 Tax=Pyricularia pennisetigena TaxID=1578925 RepID=UPI0011543C33|nr:uncharacterized protein PpBr36_10229 [Pyricularia pennisetigena]TLS21359.1 hypothetical protein PpBr36_10229 [Pyricularia pennisetigena]
MRFETMLAVASAAILALSSGAAAQRVIALPVAIYKGEGQRVMLLDDQIAGRTTKVLINDNVYSVPVDRKGTPDNRQLPNGYYAETFFRDGRVVELLPNGDEQAEAKCVMVDNGAIRAIGG